MPEKVSTTWPRLLMRGPGLGMGDLRSDTPRAIRRREERGRLLNYFGALYLWGGIDFPDFGPSFFAQAETTLQRAARLFDWYQPHENLGDTYRFWSSYQSDAASRRMLLLALASYKEAALAAEKLEDDIRGRVLRRLAIARATAMLLTGDPGLSQEALTIDKEAETEWNELVETDIPTIYNAASFHSLLRRINPSRSATDRKAAEERALWLLTVALLRKGEEYGAYLATDEDFTDLPGLEELRESALLILQRNPSIADSQELSNETVSTAREWAKERSRAMDMGERSDVEKGVHEVREMLEGVEQDLRDMEQPDEASRQSVQRIGDRLDALARRLRDVAMSMPGSGRPTGSGNDEEDA